MELLVIKAGNKYLRLTNDGIEYTTINKASVYPISEKVFVTNKLNKLSSEIEGLSIRKLTITESDL